SGAETLGQEKKSGAQPGAAFGKWVAYWGSVGVVVVRRLGGLRLFEVGAGLLVDDAHRQLHLAAVVMAEHLDLDLVAFLDDVGRLGDSALGELGDVDEAVLGAEEIDEGPKLDGLDDRAVVNRPDFRLRGDRLDPVYCGLDLGAV